jgi:NTP pyrophosphatase (non-canonical NTP hydrolase)
MKTFSELEFLTILWAQSKRICKPDNSRNQLLKFYEEAGEVAGALLKNKPEQLKSEIGDVLVTLAIFANQNGLTLTQCLQEAYDKIKMRTGETINGNFVKKE